MAYKILNNFQLSGRILASFGKVGAFGAAAATATLVAAAGN